MGSQILDDKEIQKMSAAYMSDRTTYIRGLTEIEPKRILIDDPFLERYKVLLGFVDKWTPLANFKEPKDKHLQNIKMMNAQLALNNGQIDVAYETLISAWRDIQVTRGDDGFFQKSLSTEIHEIHEEKKTSAERKVGFLNRILGGKKEENNPPVQGVQQ